MLQAILPKQKRNQVILGLLLALFIFVLLVNLFQIGQRDFVTTFNNQVMTLMLIFGSVNAFDYWRTISNRKEAQQVWAMLACGLGFYSLGQLVWMYDSLIGISTPYPSLGDVFCILGYIFLCITLFNRNRLLGTWPSKQQVAAILAFGLILFGLMVVYLLVPIFQTAEPGQTLGSAVSTFYLVMDLILLILSNFLGATMMKARLSLPWNLIATGTLILSIADLLFVYATGNSLYYPPSGINAITYTIDLSYCLASFMMSLGVFMFKVMTEVQPEQLDFQFTHVIAPEPASHQLLPYSPEVQKLFENMYFMVDPDHKVFFFSDSFRKLCQLVEGSAPQWGRPLYQVISVDAADIDTLVTEVEVKRNAVRSIDLKIGQWLIPVAIQAQAINSGLDIYLTYRRDADPVTLQVRPPVETLLINELIKSAHGLENASSEMRACNVFFIIEVQELYTFLVRMNGFRVGQILSNRFNQEAANLSAEVGIQDGRVVLNRVTPIETMAELLRITIQTVRNLTTVEVTQDMIRKLNERIPESITHAAQRAGLAL